MNEDRLNNEDSFGAKESGNPTTTSYYSTVAIDTDSTVRAARIRLIAAAKRSRLHKALTNGTYYGESVQLEETLHGISRSSGLDAVVTRNHYGCLVLNAARALFIDVDMPDLSPPVGSGDECGDDLDGRWRRTLDDLRTVLASESHEAFRIYRTAAGFRILATTREFEPGSEGPNRLMNAVGADAHFVRLCRTQNSFRARLTPKPWRCGVSAPPNLFPRHTVEEQERFEEWLKQYQCASRGRATCQHLEDIGQMDRHPRIAPIVEFHDRETKAFESLALA